MSKFQIGIMADSLNLPFRKSIEKCARLGADGVQIYAVSGEMSPDNMTEADLREKKKIIKDNGLSVSALCGDFGGHGFARREENEWRIEDSKRILDLALELDCKVVTTHAGVINLVMVTGDDPVKAAEMLAEYVVHTHAKDGIMLKQTDPKVIYDFFAEGGIGDLRLGDYFLETPLGEGKVDFASYLKTLDARGFNGFLTIEREAGQNPEQDIALAVDFLRKLISAF